MQDRVLVSKRIEAVPGQVIYSLIAPAEDETGHWWPVGTEYVPMSSGEDNHDRRYQEVLIAGQSVTFRQDAK